MVTVTYLFIYFKQAVNMFISVVMLAPLLKPASCGRLRNCTRVMWSPLALAGLSVPNLHELWFEDQVILFEEHQQ